MYTAELRKVAIRFRRSILKEMGQNFLVKVADNLFSGAVLEEKTFAVFLLQTLTDKFGETEFKLFEVWLNRISNWADHDGLVHYLIAPMIVANPKRAAVVFRWAQARDRWHRRAACVALIQGARRKMFFPEITRLSDALLGDEDDMVQKGLGWLLRETAKFDAPTDGALSDEDPQAGAAPGAADSLRDAACARTGSCARTASIMVMRRSASVPRN